MTSDKDNAAVNMTYLLDQLGSPLRFGNADGTVAENYGYGVFGKDLSKVRKDIAEMSIGMEQQFVFTGYERDGVSRD